MIVDTQAGEISTRPAGEALTRSAHTDYVYCLRETLTGDLVDETSLDEETVELATELFIEFGYDMALHYVSLCGYAA
ncbi:hypothetical protein QN358_10345 [Subtercola sp. RTI3]|nr:hypothetical protein [Subtercola sp. RTI3]